MRGWTSMGERWLNGYALLGGFLHGMDCGLGLVSMFTAGEVNTRYPFRSSFLEGSQVSGNSKHYNQTVT